MSSAFFEWLQNTLHRECDTVIAFHDGDRRAAIQAQAESAAAHHAAELALAGARETIARLEADATRERARADQAEAALETVRRTVTEPVDPTQLRFDWMDEPTAALVNTVLTRICLRNEANQHPDSTYGAYIHRLADLYQERVQAALEATNTTSGAVTT